VAGLTPLLACFAPFHLWSGAFFIYFRFLLKIIAKLLDNTENNRNFVTGFETDTPLILSNISKQQNLQHHGTSNSIYLQASGLEILRHGPRGMEAN
jgi:hypothetical protein